MKKAQLIINGFHNNCAINWSNMTLKSWWQQPTLCFIVLASPPRPTGLDKTLHNVTFIASPAAGRQFYTVAMPQNTTSNKTSCFSHCSPPTKSLIAARRIRTFPYEGLNGRWLSSFAGGYPSTLYFLNAANMKKTIQGWVLESRHQHPVRF